jgi:hypothetical protein
MAETVAQPVKYDNDSYALEALKGADRHLATPASCADAAVMVRPAA